MLVRGAELQPRAMATQGQGSSPRALAAVVLPACMGGGAGTLRCPEWPCLVSWQTPCLPGAACHCHVRARGKAQSLSWHPLPRHEVALRLPGATGLFAPSCGLPQVLCTALRALCCLWAGLPGGAERLTFLFACCPGAAEQLAAFGKVFWISGGENCSHSSTEGESRVGSCVPWSRFAWTRLKPGFVPSFSFLMSCGGWQVTRGTMPCGRTQHCAFWRRWACRMRSCSLQSRASATGPRTLRKGGQGMEPSSWGLSGLLLGVTAAVGQCCG